MRNWRQRCWSGPVDVVQSGMVWKRLVWGLVVCYCLVRSGVVQSGMAWIRPVWSRVVCCLVWIIVVESDMVLSLVVCCLVWSAVVQSGMIWSLVMCFLVWSIVVARSLALCLESAWSGLVWFLHVSGVWFLFCSVLFCSVLFCSVLFCSVLFCSVLFCSVLFCSVLFCSVLVRVWSGAVWSGVGASMAGGAPPKACTKRFCGAPDVCPRLLHIPHQGGSSQNEPPRSAAQDTQSTASALPSR